MLVTSNRSVGEWGSVLGAPVVATAILDRLLHHSQVITIRRDSYRLRETRRAGLVKATHQAPSDRAGHAHEGPQVHPCHRTARRAADAVRRAANHPETRGK